MALLPWLLPVANQIDPAVLASYFHSCRCLYGSWFPMLATPWKNCVTSWCLKAKHCQKWRFICRLMLRKAPSRFRYLFLCSNRQHASLPLVLVLALVTAVTRQGPRPAPLFTAGTEKMDLLLVSLGPKWCTDHLHCYSNSCFNTYYKDTHSM